MRIAIVEDEAIVARRLERILREIVDGCSIQIATSLDAARSLTRAPLDLLFLDLNLKGRDGFRLLEETAGASFSTVVVSAHQDQALRAFEHGVTDFVAKPYSEERLRKALARVRLRREGPAAPTLLVRKGRELQPVEIPSIAWIRGADDYSELHLRDGALHLFERNLSAIEELLPETFLRVHRSYIVNCACVAGIRPTALRLDDGSLVPVGRLYRRAVRARLGMA
jgi:DNA-binding LytR/AlgR family response regulator